MHFTPAQLDRAAGVLVATAAGDALGAGYEFGPALSPSTAVTMKGGGPFGFAPAEWTDDTSMAITIATSVLDAFDAGHPAGGELALSTMVTGWQRWAAESKDVGAQTSSVLRRTARLVAAGQVSYVAAFKASEAHHDAHGQSAGNGSLMRTAPLALAYLRPGNELALTRATGQVSRLTHHEADASDACQLWTAAIRHAVLTGELDVRVGLPLIGSDRAGLWRERIIAAETSQPRDFTKNGWVVQAFQGAWSAIFHAVAASGSVGPEALRLALENAVRGGNDTDTVAAISGGLIGGAAGYSSIPAEWRRQLHGWGATGERDLVKLSLELVAGGRRPGTWPRIPVVDYRQWRGIGTVVQHPDDPGVWIGGAAQLPFLGSHEAAAHGLPAALGEVSAVVSLCRVGEDQTPHIAAENHLVFWLVDSNEAADNAHLGFVLADAAKAVAQFRAEGRTVYLHCVQAESRTPTVAAMYGALLGGTAMESLRRIGRVLPNSHPNSAFMEVLRRTVGPRPEDRATAMDRTACPHCGGSRRDILVARNYLCDSCRGRATDVMGQHVTLFNEFHTEGATISPIGVAANHEDGSRCAEVTERARAYVDGTAFRVVEGRFGGAFLLPLASPEPNADEVAPGTEDLDNYWDRAAGSLADEIQWLKDGDFLTVDYGTENPELVVYGQLSIEDDGFHCEVVSNAFMPADDWPLDSAYLVAAGWTPPGDENPNWHRVQSGAAATAALILAGLRYGRGCRDPRRLGWEPATFPDGVDED
ncbi:ADP-ribosylglycohydrolase family protein [Arthrobacter sp. A2-55]|uniref:ADP-ribosylglycohydrolase family protein n=1 Tax=Arthrobacter sp. A2-55 TaxID=2897337 RepID=UPI0021CDB7D1|nr:ADP-ribosylglycohydrolase family protein [Arthrobacter sp. A2-55]MCU6482462.1 ADP-ribosylglycohydrolase family protein [Arthrobacter sp. A2-55]